MAEQRGAPAVLVTHDRGVATVTMNRPEAHNSLDVRLKEQLAAALIDVAGDAGVRAVLLTGAGRSFCVGQDLAEHARALQQSPAHAFDTLAQHYHPIVTALATMPKPVVAAVNGNCVGAGLGFALACDLRVVAAGARLATAFSGIGLTGDSGLSASLARTVGTARATALLLLAEPFTAEEARAWGVASRVVDDDDLARDASELAARLAEGPTIAYAETKRALAAAMQPPLADVLAHEAAAQARLGLTADHQQAVEAFLAKSKPTFTAR